MPASACCVLCYSKFMESSKQPKMTLVEIPQVFVNIIILIFIMSGIMALTQFSFNPFAFIQSYYAWIIGFVVLGYLFESGLWDHIYDNIIYKILEVLGKLVYIFILAPLVIILVFIFLPVLILP